MKEIALTLLASAVLFSAPAFAQETATAGAEASRSTQVEAGGQATASALNHDEGGDRAKTAGNHREPQCSRENPYIEYRDCVNAHTRDKNAKVRMAQAAVTAPRS
jgi:hypothetical protein